MSRELKFRVWDKHLKIFVNLNIGGLRSDYSLDDYLDDTFNDPISVFEVQQFTGLKDKNGVEIAEGDIIQYQDGSHQAPFYDKVVVEWVSENDGWVYSGWKFCDNFLQGGEFQVVGNLLENPELLK